MTSEAPRDLSGLRIDRDAPSTDDGSNRRILAIAAALVVVAAVAVLAWRGIHPAEMRVEVARAESLGGTPGASASEILTANGYVVARQRASVSTEVSGRLNKLLVEEGSRVKQGQVLASSRTRTRRPRWRARAPRSLRPRRVWTRKRPPPTRQRSPGAGASSSTRRGS